MSGEDNLRQTLGTLIGAGYLTGTRQSGKTLAVSLAIERDAAHAIALEREAIAKFLETPAMSDAYWDDPDGVGTDHALATAIRDGAHNQPTEGEA